MMMMMKMREKLLWRANEADMIEGKMTRKMKKNLWWKEREEEKGMKIKRKLM